MSMLEIYNERIQDLLSTEKRTNPFLLLEDPIRGVYVPDLTESRLSDLGTFNRLI